ncbi:centromere protein R isoform X4 [Salmo trutta]|uniref:centromere protein R isoform X4 n=1 Tax=Salmo trutta TaxID=8032 RepID=UPI001130D32A|nr:uncharacterized protein LOC115158728 isoform X4 [Salmo trutta]
MCFFINTICEYFDIKDKRRNYDRQIRVSYCSCFRRTQILLQTLYAPNLLPLDWASQKLFVNYQQKMPVKRTLRLEDNDNQTPAKRPAPDRNYSPLTGTCQMSPSAAPQAGKAKARGKTANSHKPQVPQTEVEIIQSRVLPRREWCWPEPFARQRRRRAERCPISVLWKEREIQTDDGDRVMEADGGMVLLPSVKRFRLAGCGVQALHSCIKCMEKCKTL